MNLQAKARLSSSFMGMTEDTEGQVATPATEATQGMGGGMDIAAGYRLMDTVPAGFFPPMVKDQADEC